MSVVWERGSGRGAPNDMVPFGGRRVGKMVGAYIRAQWSLASHMHVVVAEEMRHGCYKLRLEGRVGGGRKRKWFLRIVAPHPEPMMDKR